MSASRVAMRRRSRRRGLLADRGPQRRSWALVAFGGFVVSTLVVAVALMGGAAIFALGEYNKISDAVGPAEEVIAQYSRGGAVIRDRHGREMYQFVDPLAGLRRPVPLSEISPWLIDGTIAVEDPDFWDNQGINLRGTIRAGVENFAPFLIGGGGFLEGTGGSSITQQLARNVYMTVDERQERTVERKLKEMVIARELTERYPKEQILEWYLNSISYGGIYTGVQAAAEGYFGKSASDLTIAEAALLAGIPQSPSDYNPFGPANYDQSNGTLSERGLAKQRQLQVLHLMESRGVITAEEAKEAREQPILFKQSRFDIEAPHFVLGRIASEVEARLGPRAIFEMGLDITTTIDLDLQHMAEEIVDRNVRDYGEQANLHNGAFVAIDPKTGQILVYVGSRDYFREDIDGRNDNAIGLNSPGSTLKPFTFMTAFMNGWGTGTAILDTPLKIVDFSTGEEWSPRNPIAEYQGPITAAKALGNSLNVTAIKTIMYAGVPNTISTLKRVGYTTLDNPLGYGPALTTGGSDITLLDQIIGYSVLATNGIMRGQEALTTPALDPGERVLEPVAILRIQDADGRILYQFTEPEQRRVVAAEYAWLVTSILADGQNQCITYGVCNALALPNGYPSAAKTGTSEPFEDSRDIGETWTIGYTPELVAGIWAGNSDNSRIQGITSTSVSLRAWKEFMVAAIEHLNLPRTNFQRPSGIAEREVCWPSGKLPTDACPQMNRYTSLYAAEVLPRNPQDRPDMYDSWWQRVSIDVRTGLPASPQTPAQFVRHEVRLVLPQEEIKDWAGLGAWMARNAVSGYVGPTTPGTDGGQLFARIDSPLPGQTVTGEVQVRGRAASPEFLRYAVEWGRGSNPTSWARIHNSVTQVNGGLLATWNTSILAPGEYTVRVLVYDATLGERRYQVTVRVGEPGSGGEGQPQQPPADQAPVLSISAPLGSARVTGTVSVTGVATSPNLLIVAIDVGEGLSPGSWQRVYLRPDGVVNGVIGVWNTTSVANGPWTIRVVLHDAVFGETATQILVIVDNPVAQPAQ
jgi:membrane peptidoglycan carboxypeptidase